MGGLLPWTDDERAALSRAVVNAVDADAHRDGYCLHCGKVKALCAQLMGDRATLARLIDLRRHAGKLLREEGL